MPRRSLTSLSPARATTLLAGSIAVSSSVVLALCWVVLGTTPSAWLGVALGFVGFELGVVVALGVANAVVRPGRAARARDASSAAEVPAVSVLVAAWNEAPTIRATVEGLLAQTGVVVDVVVADDGSTDGTASAVPRHPSVRVLVLAHGGKGAALEAARRIARHPIVVTVDADTELAPGALARLAAAFDDPETVAAGGAVLVRGARSLLMRFQLVEYVKTTWTRNGWAALGMLEQLPGAFSAFRASALEEAGGFPLDSLTEDYEVTYRLHRAFARSGRPLRIAYVPSACAWTDPPRTLGAFVRQRTRWFAGFLSTLWRFRALVLWRRAGIFGLVRLPLKLVDAGLPLTLLASLAVVAWTAASGSIELTRVAVALLALRVATEAAVFAAANALYASTVSLDAARDPERRVRWTLALVEPFTYAWLRMLAVVRAYPFALLRVRTWERSREVAAAPPPVPPSDAAIEVPAE